MVVRYKNNRLYLVLTFKLFVKGTSVVTSILGLIWW